MADRTGQHGEQAGLGIDLAADVIVVGGGLAGLAGALTLVRARRSVLVVDAGHPRNAPAAHAHGYLTRDGASPLELLAAGRAEVAGYSGQIMTGTATSLARLPGVSIVEGEVTGVEVTGGRLSGLRLRSGQIIPRHAVVIGPQFEARHALLDGLGVAIAEHPLGIGHQVPADATGRTTAAGVWVAGNTADVTAGVMQSAASGVTAAAAINADLTAEDTTAAVAARRARLGVEA
jgi:thioredoxin reductase